MFLAFKRTYLAAATLGLALALLISSQAPATDNPADPGYAKTVIAKVDDYEITREMIQNAINQVLPYRSFHSSISETRLKSFQKKALEDLIDGELIYQAGLKEKSNVTKKEVDAAMEAVKRRVPEGQTFDDILKDSNMTEKDVRNELTRSLIIVKKRNQMIEVLKKQTDDLVTEDFVHDYYNKHMDKFMMPEKVHIRSILIKADPGGGQRVWNQSRNKAMEIAERARKGEDFAELAKQYSEDPMASSGGDIGWAHKGSLFDEIEMAIETLKPGEVSAPVMTLYGYHVVKLEGREPAIQLKYSEINKEKLEKELIAKEFTRLRKEWLESLRSNAKVEYLNEM